MFTPFSFPYINRCCQCRKPGSCMNNNSPGKINHTPLLKYSTTPDHVNKWIIHEYLPKDQKENIRFKSNAIDKSPCDQCGCNDGKHHLIGKKNIFGKSFTRHHGLWGDSVQKCLIEI